MPALLFVLKYWRVIAAVVGIVGLLGGAGIYVAKIKHDAYQSGYEAARAKCEQEKAAQEAANRKVMEEATKALDTLQRQLELKQLQVDDVLKAIDLAADADPNGGTCGLDVGSVRRIGAIQ
jgi:uncharacterized protein HemX